MFVRALNCKCAFDANIDLFSLLLQSIPSTAQLLAVLHCLPGMGYKQGWIPHLFSGSANVVVPRRGGGRLAGFCTTLLGQHCDTLTLCISSQMLPFLVQNLSQNPYPIQYNCRNMMFDANVHDVEVQSACQIQKCGAKHRKFYKLSLKRTYLVEKQTLCSTLLSLKNHTLSSTSRQTLTLCSIKSCKIRTLSVLAWVYYFLMGATKNIKLGVGVSDKIAPNRAQLQQHQCLTSGCCM